MNSLIEMELFHVAYYCKLICLTNLIRIFSDLEKFELFLKGKFLHQIVIIDNIFDLARIQMVFFISIHVMTVFWTKLNTA